LAKKKRKIPTAPLTTSLDQEVKPWYKKTWPWVTGTAVVIGWFLLNGITAIRNAELLPLEISRLYTKACNWYHTDQEWTGYWTNEGEIDARSQHSIYVDLDLLVQSDGVQGTITSVLQSEAIPFEYVLVEGESDGDSLKIRAFDHFQGIHKEIATFSVARIKSEDLEQIKLTTIWQSQPWYPKEAVLWRTGETKLLPDEKQEN